MNFVLSVITPPQGAAGYGTATASDPKSLDDLHTVAYWALRTAAPWMHADELSRYAGQIVSTTSGAEKVESFTGLRFRIDAEEDAPHPCPCCLRLVLPKDYIYADAKDAYCLGCVAWKRDIPACLAVNTAHGKDR